MEKLPTAKNEIVSDIEFISPNNITECLNVIHDKYKHNSNELIEAIKIFEENLKSINKIYNNE